MDISVAMDAEGHQVLLGVVSQSAACVEVVYLKISKVPTTLAAPSVPLQHLSAQSSIGFRAESHSRASWAK